MLAIDLAKAHPQGGASSHSQCGWIDGQHKCIFQTCTYSPDGRRICDNSEGTPSEGNNSGYYQGQTSQYHCDFSTGTRRCFIERCTISQYGQRTCSTSPVYWMSNKIVYEFSSIFKNNLGKFYSIWIIENKVINIFK